MSARFPALSRDELISQLRAGLPTLARALPLRRVVLFGSWSTGRSTAFSDVDLLVVHDDPPRSDAYSTVRRALRVRGLEPHVYSESEAAALRATLARMTRGGVTLFERASER